ncbi:MAG: hypothetical protein ACRD3R_16360, partial [Terriglobales bacterium]
MDPVRAHREREGGFPVFELRQDLLDLAAGAGVGTRTRLRRSGGLGAPHRFRIDVIAQPQEYR